MAIGIFLLGAIHQFSTIEHKLGDAISFIIFISRMDRDDWMLFHINVQ
ncbi:hypothetical protein ACOQFO_04535 [Ureibacillus sp. MALMAid1270]